MQGRPIRDRARHLLGENPFAPGFGQRKVLIDSRNSSIPISIGFDAVWPVTGGVERASAIFFAMGHNRFPREAMCAVLRHLLLFGTSQILNGPCGLKCISALYTSHR